MKKGKQQYTNEFLNVLNDRWEMLVNAFKNGICSIKFKFKGQELKFYQLSKI